MSRFLSFAIPVRSVSEAREYIELYRKEYYDARHVCWAYMIGHERTCFRANDNGEPSGTAGKPIMGQINSNNLTDILVVVVRYFGGIKLGTGGLIVAYRQAAAEAIAACNIVERLVEDTVHIRFEYPLMNDVMRIVKEEQPTVLSQSFEMDCEMSLRLRRSAMPRMCARLEKVQGLTFYEIEPPLDDDDDEIVDEKEICEEE
ncbi:MAG: YigZ family protein [Bacteroidaceae bacterium]|nr:YigZ family protein [Bacteroidaceae bacterium]